MLKENKFLVGLGVITAVGAGGLIFWGLGQGSELETLQNDINTKKSALADAQNLNPFPTRENATAKAESIEAVLAQAKDARAKLLAFNPESLDNISGSEFSQKLKTSVAKVVALFPGEKAIPKNFNLGFEDYAEKLPPEESTGHLAFQLEAMEYLLTQYAEAGGEEVINIHRHKIPLEEGKAWPKPSTKVTFKRVTTRDAKGRRKTERVPVPPEVARRFPVEFTFKASEAVTRDFITRIANSDKFFFDTHFGRVVNPAPIPSGGKEAREAGASGAGEGGIVVEEGNSGIVVEEDGGGDIVVEGDNPAPTPAPAPAPALPDRPAKSEEILKKVSGNEDLEVFLKLDLLLFIEEIDFPKTR